MSLNMKSEFMFIIYVENQEKSKLFYQKLLRKDPSLDVPGMTEFELSKDVTLGIMPSDGIVRILENKIPHPKEGHGIPRCEIYIFVENPEEFYNRVIKAGGTGISNIELRSWGDYVAYGADPDGHIIAFAKRGNMKLKIRKVILHGSQELYIYIPLKVPRQLTAIDPIVWDKAILGNSVAYEFLKNLFIVASNLESQQFIYIPTNSMKLNEYRDIWEYGIFDMDIVLINYHSSQLKAKEIFKAIKEVDPIAEEIKDIIIEEKAVEYPKYWLTDRKLATKRFKKLLIIWANKDVFLKLSCDAEGMTGLVDDEEHNFNYHIHEDLIGTSKDNGFNFLYYHKKLNL